MTFGARELLVEPPDAASACQAAESFLRDWMPDVELGSVQVDHELVATESRLGMALPSALRWAYRQFGPSGGGLYCQDPLVHVGSLTADSDHIISFHREQQGCVEWGFRAGAGDDPPVLIKDNTVSGRSRWEAYQSRVSLHILEGVLTEAVLAGTHAANLELTPEALLRLERLPLLGIPAHALWTNTTGDHSVTWRGQPDAIVRNDADTWLWALGRSREDLHRLLETIPGSWTVL